MKKLICVSSMLLALLGLSVCFAESDIPSLVGTWMVKSEGGVLLKGKEQNPKTHQPGVPFSTLTAEAVITKQQGRIMQGTFKSAKATENFVAAIGHDNRSLYFADDDGFLEGKIINIDTIEIVYRQVTPADTVVAVGMWTRKK